MCNQRERLIGYVYDECDAGARAEVQSHLESCAECRTEIAALRSVRTDLQTWEVPDHESVWRPFAPAHSPNWWSQVPRWAMAAAAGVMLMAGAGGGAASYALLRAEPAVSAGPAQAVDAVTRRDIDRLERLITAQAAQINDRVQLASSRSTPAMPADLAASLHDVFDKQLAELRAMNDSQREVINGLYTRVGQMQTAFDIQHGMLKRTVTSLAAAVDQGQGR